MSEDDVLFVENFIQLELVERLTEMCNRLKIPLDDNVNSHFFGSFTSDINNFQLSNEERSIIFSLPECVEHFDELDSTTMNNIEQKIKQVSHWFYKSDEGSKKELIPVQNNTLETPSGSVNLLTKMLEAAKINSRPCQGYRYKNDLKYLAVYNRILTINHFN